MRSPDDDQDRTRIIAAGVQRAMTAVAIVSFAGYAVAGALWFYGQLLSAVLVATLAFVLFRSMRPIAYALARMRLISRPGFDAAFARIDRAAEERGLVSVLMELQRGSRAE